MAPAEFTNEGSTSTITFSKVEPPAFVPMSIPAVDGFNLSEFSLCPLGQKTKHLANNTLRHEWVQVFDDGSERECFFEKSYGNIAPNGETEDILVLLTQLAINSDDPLSFKASVNSMHMARGFRHRPSGRQVREYFRHLDALFGMAVHTNFVYDREKKNWKSVKTRVLAGYSYKDDEGKIRNRKVRKKSPDGEPIEVIVEERVKELDEINFNALFYKHFIKDTIPLDLGIYFSLGRPTEKRVFRFGNKYIQTYGFFSMDLQLFCLSRIGMSPAYVTKYRPSTLASKLRPSVKRVNETQDVVHAIIEPSQTPSGYKINFSKKSKQLVLHSSFTSGFTRAEEDAFQLLRKQGLYSNIARDVVVESRKVCGKDAALYVDFVVRQFNKDWVKTGKLKVPKSKIPGVLKTAFDKAWYYPHFIEWRARKEKREHQEEIRKYGKEVVELASKMDMNRPRSPAPSSVTANPRTSSFANFQNDYPEVYKRITEEVRAKYDTSEMREMLSQTSISEMVERSITQWCRNCFEEFQKGNDTYFPTI